MDLRSLEAARAAVAEEGKPFWELVLEADMDNRMVSREASWEKMRTTWRAMVDASEAYTGRRRTPSGLAGGENVFVSYYVTSAWG